MTTKKYHTILMDVQYVYYILVYVHLPEKTPCSLSVCASDALMRVPTSELLFNQVLQ